MIIKDWVDVRGHHNIQLFTYEKRPRVVYQINGEVVDDETVPDGFSVDQVVGRMISQSYGGLIVL